MSAQAIAAGHDPDDSLKMELLQGAYEGNTKKVMDCVTKQKVPVDSTDDDGVTALQIAAFTGHRPMAAFLLDNGADIELPNQLGMTPFHHACREGKMEIIDLLLQRGANIHKLTTMGVNAITLAAGCGQIDVIKKLVSLRVDISGKNTAGLAPTPLIAAAFRNYPQICGHLILRGANVDEAVESLNRLTALSCVLICNMTSNVIFSSLLDLGADPYKRTFERKTVAELAEEYNRIDIINMIHYKERRREIPLDIDIRKMIIDGKLEGYDFLKEKDNLYCDGTSPLMYAVINANSQAVKRLLESDVKYNITETKYGLTALHFSCLLRFDDITGMLLLKGADTSIQTSFQLTAFDFLLYPKDELDNSLRSMTHTYRPSNIETKLALSASSNALSKMLQHGGQKPKEWITKFSSQLGIAPERPLEAVTIEMRDWLKSRVHTSSVEGRNHKKLIRLEQLLRQEKTVMPPKPQTIDTVVEVAKQIAAEAQSFNVDCFFDYYDAITDKKDEIAPWPFGNDYDQAIYYSNLYVYQQKSKSAIRRESLERIHINRRESLENTTIERRRVPPRNAALLEGSSQNQMRTTPRMLKKSRESIQFEAESPRLQGAPFVYQEQLRKTTSTPMLANGPPNHLYLPSYSNTIHSPARLALTIAEKIKKIPEEEIWNEMMKLGLVSCVEMFKREEVDGEIFFTLNDGDLIKMGVDDANDRMAILGIQNDLYRRC